MSAREPHPVIVLFCVEIHLWTTPSGLTRRAFDPVPAMRTIPPTSVTVARVPTVSLQTSWWRLRPGNLTQGQCCQGHMVCHLTQGHSVLSLVRVTCASPGREVCHQLQVGLLSLAPTQAKAEAWSNKMTGC